MDRIGVFQPGESPFAFRTELEDVARKFSDLGEIQAERRGRQVEQYMLNLFALRQLVDFFAQVKERRGLLHPPHHERYRIDVGRGGIIHIGALENQDAHRGFLRPGIQLGITAGFGVPARLGREGPGRPGQKRAQAKRGEQRDPPGSQNGVEHFHGKKVA